DRCYGQAESRWLRPRKRRAAALIHRMRRWLKWGPGASRGDDQIIRRVPPFFKGQDIIDRKMADHVSDTFRKPRTDAVRNRERVLESAKAVFSAGGSEATLEAVAKHAGVGIGTLYRHFPTREALYEAVYRREVEQLTELAEQLKNEAVPIDALRRWLRS